MKTVFMIIILMIGISSTAQRKKGRIIVEADTAILSKFAGKDTSDLTTLYYYQWGDSTRTNSRGIRPVITRGKLRWVINVNRSILFTSSGNNSLFNAFFPAYPGDKIYMGKQGDKAKFSGKGGARSQLLYEIDEVKKRVTRPTKYVVDVESMGDYLLADKYYDEILEKTNPLIESYSKKIKAADLEWVKRWTVEWVEYYRLMAFSNAAQKIAVDTTRGPKQYSMADAHAIWDSTQFKPWAKWLRNQSDYNNMGGPLYFYHFARTETWLRYDFDYLHNDSLRSKPIRTLLYYEAIKKNYKGVLRERVFNYLIDEQVIMEMGANHKMTKQILNDYYSLPGFASYKKWIKKLEIKSAESTWKDNWAPPFELIDTVGRSFTKNQLKGKIAVLDFWFTGCAGCIQMAPSLRKVEDHFKRDTNVVFIGISTDVNKERWLQSVREGRYTSGSGIQLYTGGAGTGHQMIRQYEVQSYPTMAVIDLYGDLVITNPPPDARDEDGKLLIKLIQQQLLRLQDGPYVFYKDQQPTAWSVDAGHVESKKIDKENPTVTSLTDDYNKQITIRLRSNLAIPPSEYTRPDTLLALSDIEGNFGALKKLLQVNQVIDENYNWAFGKGHLVFSGDMFDRGEQVTQCLWLIYSLEQKAKEAGGYVHFILGNHEIMNLQGDSSYVKQKYKDNATLLGKTLVQLYNEDSELGRWLRTKNIIEKMGDLLFMHGGISSEINEAPVTVTEINQLARPYYAEKRWVYEDKRVDMIMSSSTGPFWYRGLYKDNSEKPKATMQQVDSTLKKFNVTHIITGHSIVADTISVHFGRKVINTDTRHARGKSEALLIQGNKYYRINGEGEKTLLFMEGRRAF